jgi:haloalkane dehalogenase
MRAAFGDHELVERPDANHYIQEDAPERITEAIRERFG